MTNEEFKEAQIVLGLSNAEMAKKLHYNVSMIEHFRSGRQPVGSRCAAFIKLLIEYQWLRNKLVDNHKLSHVK